MTKNITFSADAALIEKARQKAAIEKRTLNMAFREWLSRYVAGGTTKGDFDELMDELCYARAGRSFSRDEMNER